MTWMDEVDGQVTRLLQESSSPLEPLPLTAPLPASFPPPGRKPNWTGANKAILFDVYGTMVISIAGDITAGKPFHDDLKPKGQIQRLLNDFGIDMSPQKVKERFSAEVIRQHRRLKAQGIDHPEICYPDIWASVLERTDAEALKVFAARYETTINPVWPMPHLKKTLAVLKEKQVVMGIISNAQFFTPMLFPAVLGQNLIQLGFCPDLLFFSYEHGYAKPSDYLFKKAAAVLTKFGIQPKETAYIGNDMLNDVLPAQRAGFKGILFAGDRRSLRLRQDRPECSSTIPNAVVTGLHQLQDYY